MKEKLELIPHLPGSYQMKDKNGVVIYVGKAKDLYKRVNSYFNKEQFGKTKMLVSEITDFSYIITNTEIEAFILEINLIKKYDPKYNILLKDDKSYPYIEYISKPYPKLVVSRYLKIKKRDNKLLFGPYPNAYAARRIVNLLNRLYPLKKCEGMPKEVCLYYHIGECLGYCTKNIDEEKVKNMENEIISFLKGDEVIIKNKLLEKIKYYSDMLNYESASELKKELEYMEVVLNKQKVELHDYINRDVISYFEKDSFVCVQILFVRNGKILGSNHNIFSIISDKNDEISSYIINFYQKHEIPNEILINENINNDILEKTIGIKFLIPIKGIKKKLIEMATLNAKINLENEIKTFINKENNMINANEKLKNLLNLKSLKRIEAFDNSNLFGSFSVSGMIVFINGKEAKNEYRKYKISFDKNDDYNMMKEVIYRRYYKVLVDKLEKPDLILVDGAINQINACKEILNSLNLNIKVCGLKKDDKHQTKVLIDGDTLKEINLTNEQNVFLYLTKIQDEVHRYTINYHKQIRSKGMISSVLDSIPGIGKIRKKELLKKFGSLKKIKNAKLEELDEILPHEVSLNLIKFLKEKDF